MLGWWTELLPLFLVRWMALRHCERMTVDYGAIVATARPDVLVRVANPRGDCYTCRRFTGAGTCDSKTGECDYRPFVRKASSTGAAR